jgi:flagellar hook-associated protein 3 FlgL
VFSRGSAAASDSTDAGTLNTLAGEVRSLRDEILALANTQVRGRYIFSGSMVDTAAYTMVGEDVAYGGDTTVNEVEISNGMKLKQNIAGSEVFDPVFARVRSLLTAMDNGDRAAIKDALAQFSGMFTTVNQVRARLGVTLGKVQDAVLTRQGLESSIKDRQTQVEGADMAEAISTISRTQTALQAAFQVGSVVGKTSLMDYLF